MIMYNTKYDPKLIGVRIRNSLEPGNDDNEIDEAPGNDDNEIDEAPGNNDNEIDEASGNDHNPDTPTQSPRSPITVQSQITDEQMYKSLAGYTENDFKNIITKNPEIKDVLKEIIKQEATWTHT